MVINVCWTHSPHLLSPWFPESLIDLREGEPLLVKQVLDLEVEPETLESCQFHGDLHHLLHRQPQSPVPGDRGAWPESTIVHSC